jgi:hypothetical protein
MGTNDIARATRRQKRQRTLGTEAQCSRCGWPDATALTKTGGEMLCYECQCLSQSRATLEQHHHLGRAVDPATVPVPGNVHRDLSDRQYDWPAAVRTNPQRDPLLWLAAALFGLRDHLDWWTTWLERIAHWFVALSEALAARDGERWWEALELAPVWQEVTS